MFGLHKRHLRTYPTGSGVATYWILWINPGASRFICRNAEGVHAHVSECLTDTWETQDWERLI